MENLIIFILVVITMWVYSVYEDSKLDGIKSVKRIDIKQTTGQVIWGYLIKDYCPGYYYIFEVEYIDGRKRILKYDQGSWQADKLKEISYQKKK